MHSIVPLIHASFYASNGLSLAIVMISLQDIETRKEQILREDVQEGLIRYYWNHGTTCRPDTEAKMNILVNYACEGMSMEKGIEILKRLRDECDHTFVSKMYFGKRLYKYILNQAKTLEDFHFVFQCLLYIAKSNPIRRKITLVQVAKQKLSPPEHQAFKTHVLEPTP